MQHQHLHIRTQGIDINTDVTTWALPEGAIARLGRGTGSQFAISPDRRYLAVGTAIGVWLYELSKLSPIALWETERGVISELNFSPNGKRLAVGNIDGHVKIWDVPSGICIAKIERPKRSYKSDWFDVRGGTIVFSPNNQYVAASRDGDGIVYLWDTETGEMSNELFPDPEIKVGIGRPVHLRRPLCFSVDGQLLACASPINTEGITDFIAVWDAKSSKQIATLKGPTALVHSLDFSPCGKLLAAGDASATVHEWDIFTGKQVQVASIRSRVVIPAYSTSGILHAIGSSKTSITVWDVKHTEKLNTFKNHENIRDIRFSKGTASNGSVTKPVVVFSDTRTINVWTLDTEHIIASIFRDPYRPDFLIFSSDSQTLASGGWEVATCWDVTQKQSRQIMICPEACIRSIDIRPDGNIRALGNIRNTLKVWDVETNETVATITKHKKYVSAATFAPTSEHWASADIEGKLYIWDSKGKQTALSGHTNSIETLAFHPSGQQLISGSRDGTALLWDVASGEVLTVLPLTQLDAELYLGDSHQKQRLMRIQDSRARRGDTIYPSVEIKTIAFSPCGNIIAGGLNWEIRLWDATTYDIRTAILLPRECQRPYALAFSPSGQYLISGSWWAGTEKVSIRLWDITTCENIHTFWGHPTDIQDLAFSPDGTLLASGSYDGTILLWDMKPFIGS